MQKRQYVARNTNQENSYTDDQKNDKKDLQNITHKTKDRVIRIPLKPGLNSGAPEG
jgi:hypothetical protein